MSKTYMRQFAYETDAPTAEAAMSQVADMVGVAGAASVWASPKVALKRRAIPVAGSADNVKGHLTDAYFFASSNRYEMPSDEAVDGTGWEVASREGDDESPLSDSFCVAIDCGIPSWDVVSYRKVPRTKATARFHLRFVVEVDGEPVGDFGKVSEAKAMAHAVAADPSCVGLDEAPYEIAIRRRPVSDGNSDLATMYQRRSRTTKSRPAKVPEGATVTATHHWLVYGKVPEDGEAVLSALASKAWDRRRNDAVIA